jgi:hypothetical protein
MVFISKEMLGINENQMKLKKLFFVQLGDYLSCTLWLNLILRIDLNSDIFVQLSKLRYER